MDDGTSDVAGAAPQGERSAMARSSSSRSSLRRRNDATQLHDRDHTVCAGLVIGERRDRRGDFEVERVTFRSLNDNRSSTISLGTEFNGYLRVRDHIEVPRRVRGRSTL
jgi:hypothetical protein